MRQRRLLLFLILVPAFASCSRPPGIFSESNARAHVGMLAGTIGTRAIGTPPNARARGYIVEQLRQYGLDVRVQEADARRREFGLTARVSNIIGILPGRREEAIGLLSHYDSTASTPGAADDALGVAVSIEAARIVASWPEREWSLLVLITDGEEAGLMGAAALMTDRQITDRLKAYINLEAVGSSGTPVLFETGPGNEWLIAPWALRAPHPRGGSYGIEVYKRLPNDTDFSIVRKQDIPGLNFAAVEDSYAYHTARDTPERLSPATIRTAGENVVAIVNALQREDVARRTQADATYFDIGGTVAVKYGPVTAAMLASGALLIGLLAWLRVLRRAIRALGVLRWLLTALWTVLGASVTAASMVGVTWLLRASRETLHPWYARPGRLFLLLLATGVTVAWSMSRTGQWLPRRAHGPRHPSITWSITLPVWIALTAAAVWVAPAAAYLWTIPLLWAGVLLALVSGPFRTSIERSAFAWRGASMVILAVAAALWVRESRDLLFFMVAVLGRLTIVTPVWVYAATMCVVALVIVPPLVAALGASRPLVRPSVGTTVLLLATVGAAAAAYRAPAYTYEQPLRRHVRALQEEPAGEAVWEVGSLEPGVDLTPDAPPGWALATAPATTRVPWGRLTHPFVFRTNGPSLGAPPVTVTAFTAGPLPDGAEVTVNVVPQVAGASVSFILPAGVEPARSNLPGIERLGQWVATYVSVPPEGVAWRASFGKIPPDRLRDVRVTATLPRRIGDSSEAQGFPAWLPQDHTVWSGTATWVLPHPGPLGAVIAPVAPLR